MLPLLSVPHMLSILFNQGLCCFISGKSDFKYSAWGLNTNLLQIPKLFSTRDREVLPGSANMRCNSSYCWVLPTPAGWDDLSNAKWPGCGEDNLGWHEPGSRLLLPCYFLLPLCPWAQQCIFFQSSLALFLDVLIVPQVVCVSLSFSKMQ